jgi:hypothetical protein
MLDALAVIRDTIAEAEELNDPICVLSLDLLKPLIKSPTRIYLACRSIMVLDLQ